MKSSVQPEQQGRAAGLHPLAPPTLQAAEFEKGDLLLVGGVTGQMFVPCLQAGTHAGPCRPAGVGSKGWVLRCRQLRPSTSMTRLDLYALHHL